jgi:CHAT domain-containing protein
VVSFFTGDDRSFVFALTKEGLSTATLPGTRRLGADVAAYRDLLSSRPAAGTSRIAALTRRADALTTSLFGPIASAINGKKRLILLPDGPLNALPFEALGVVRVTGRAAPRGTWLTEQFALSYAPSASALAALDTRPANGTRLLALGDPLVSAPPTQTRDASVPFTALPFTRIEVQKITGLFGADGHADLGAAATPDALTKNPLDSYRYIHIAAHAFVNTVRPGRSGIVLAPLKGDHDASILQADDVMRLTLSADLVTLSACSTALGRTVSREGVMGLTRSFLIAGARSVVASLWNVNDEATATLMERFYTQLRARKPKDEALSAARLSLIRGTNERLKDPYYWAPFILIGAR